MNRMRVTTGQATMGKPFAFWSLRNFEEEKSVSFEQLFPAFRRDGINIVLNLNLSFVIQCFFCHVVDLIRR